MSIRKKYEQHGAEEYYRKFGVAYRNPHEPEIQDVISEAVKTWPLDLSNVLDLAAGSGEVTIALAEHHAGKIAGVDPFTAAAYAQRTGKAAEKFDFAQIAAGALEGRRYSLIVCSFALHLCEPSRLPALAYRLAQISDAL
ncbi:MAG TPA: class I SAM-dependent methyltransferase, partial [Tepidisphaeraceae bacterium]|nr:class I SAM-dependent methyltransferase [Tepidisphaeraceae bacterium]